MAKTRGTSKAPSEVPEPVALDEVKGDPMQITCFPGMAWTITSAGHLHVATTADLVNGLFSYGSFTTVELIRPPRALEVCCLNCAVLSE